MNKHNDLVGQSNILESISVICLLTIVSLLAIILSSPPSYSESANASVTVGSACSISANVVSAHTAEVPAGSNRTEIGTTNIKAICNDAGGFAIYAIGYTDNEFGNNKMTSSTSFFNTGTSISGANSAWSMKLAQVTTGTYATTIDGGYGSYSNVPSAYTKVAHMNSSTDPVNAATLNGSTISLTYASYISTTQDAGTYNGQVKFTLVHPATEVPLQPQNCVANRICYYANGSNVVGTMGQQTVSSNNVTVTLLASNYSRKGYGFAGWSTTYDYSDPEGFYGPQEDITTPADQTTKGLSLYAHWVKSAGDLQTWSCPDNISMPIGSVTALTDLRDNETYAVAKLVDNNCWMIENLRLEAEGSTYESLSQGFGTIVAHGNFKGLATAESANFTVSTSSSTAATTANSLYYAGTQSGTASINIVQDYYAGARMPRYNNNNNQSNSSNRPQNPTTNSATNSTTNAGMYSYGNYYTWAAAMANTSPYYTPTGIDDNGFTSDNVNTSICPDGWRLPRGGNKSRESYNDYWNLIVSKLGNGTLPANYNSVNSPYYTTGSDAISLVSSIRTYPNNFIYSGYISNASISNRGSTGYYWATTSSNVYLAYMLSLSIDNLIGTTHQTKSNGHPIRCMRDNTVNNSV